MTVAKNYLEKPEIDELNRIVVMWLDYAEDQARRRRQVFMKDWEQKLDEFLKFNDRKVLPHAGKVGKKKADLIDILVANVKAAPKKDAAPKTPKAAPKKVAKTPA